MTHAIRHGGAKTCALSLDGEHENRLLKKSLVSPREA
jgi:hypothetical protein